jgi:hypothetical protein
MSLQQIGNILFLSTSGGVSSTADIATFIMHKNLMPLATVLEGGDIAALHDNLTNIFYTGDSGVTNIELQLPSAQTINCFAVAGANLQTAAMSISLYLWDADESEYYLVITATSGRDNQPVMVVFENQISSKAKIVITAAGDFQVGEIAFGQCLKMPCSPSVGFVPARWNTEDEITHHTTQSNYNGRSTINTRGNKEVLPFRLIPHEWIRTNWTAFIDEAKGLPVWVGWNQEAYPAECIYGTWEQDTASYSSPLFGGFTLTIKGQA